MCHKFAASDNNVAIIIIQLAIAQGALPEIIIQKLKYTVNSGTNRSLCKFMYPFIIIYFQFLSKNTILILCLSSRVQLLYLWENVQTIPVPLEAQKIRMSEGAFV